MLRCFIVSIVIEEETISGKQLIKDVFVGLNNSRNDSIRLVLKMARSLIASTSGIQVKTTTAFEIFEYFQGCGIAEELAEKTDQLWMRSDSGWYFVTAAPAMPDSSTKIIVVIK